MRKRNSATLKTRLIIVGICGIMLLIAALAVPRRGGTLDINDRGLKGGPDSYFRHIYDPQHLLGPVGKIDLELDNFQRATGNALLFAAFPSLPSEDPYFTMQVAESWAPGRKSDDHGVVVFLFMKEKRIRVEIGYGFEEVLTDIATKHLIEKTMLPLLRSGQITEAVEAAGAALQEILAENNAKRRGKITLRSELPSLFAELKRRAGFMAGIWLHGAALLRMILGGVVLWAIVAVVWMFVSLLLAFRGLANFVYRAASQKDLSGAKEALGGIIGSLIGIGQAALLVFIFGTMGEYFRSGTGMFGGGGVNLFW